MFAQKNEERKCVTVSLEEIAEKLEETMDHWEQFLNVATGEVEALSDGTYIEVNEELARQIEESDDYIQLPNRYEIHEYRIMERFAMETRDERKQAKLFQAPNGKRPYRRFKDEINYHGLAEAYYVFRFLVFIEIAREWCEGNGIPYETKRATESSVLNV